MNPSLSKLIVIFQAFVIVGLILSFFHYCSRQESEVDRIKHNHNFELTKSRNALNQEITRANVYEGSLKELRKDSSRQLERLQAIQKEYGAKLQAATAITIRAKESVSGKPIVEPKDTVRKGGIVFVYPIYRDTINRLFSKYRLYMSKDSSNIVAEITIPVEIANIKAGKRPRLFAPRPLVIDVKLVNPATETESLTSFSKQQPRQYRGLKILGAFISGAAAVKLGPILLK